MVIFMYTDKKYEYQAIACITSLTYKITDDVTILYYTIGFESSFEFKNLKKIKIDPKPYYPSFYYYKADLSLLTMDLYPNEYYYFTDTDVLFSKKFNFQDHRYNESYPMASYGPHEYPFTWQLVNGVKHTFDETKLMKYFGVPSRSMRYCWSCFYTFNPNCREFFEEYISMCHNGYLMARRGEYFPYSDETPFNICLWKRNATKNLGFAFVNTHFVETVKAVEENLAKHQHLGQHVDAYGSNWQYVEDPDKVLLYHGFKDPDGINEALAYLLK